MQDHKLIDLLGEEFRELWRRKPTSVEQFLSQQSISNESSTQLTIRLIKHEIELRRSAGERCSASEYQERFPNVDAEVLNNLFSMPAPPPVSVLKPLLPNRYQPIKQIGKGGIGSVWQVDDRDMDRTLAVKVLHTKLEKETSANLRLKREAMLTGSLQHPGIPPVFEYGSLVGGSNYFAMKLVEGETLDNTFEKQSGPELLAIFRQVAEAVGFAHSRNVIHRDLKPQNIMVGAFGEVQIMDWGLAKDLNAKRPAANNGKDTPEASPESEIETSDNSIDSSYIGVNSELTRHGDVVGTPAYMSPEQARGELDSLGPATDVYSLGAMLFEILTGKRWYRVRPDDADPASVDAILNANLDSDTIADPLAELCKQCLESDQRKRPANGTEVANFVGDYQSKLAQRLKETEIERATAEAKTEEERKRSRLRLGLLGAILLSGLMGITGFAWYQVDQANKKSVAQSDFEVGKQQIIALRDRADFEAVSETTARIESKVQGVDDELSKAVVLLKRDNEIIEKIETARNQRKLDQSNKNRSPIPSGSRLTGNVQLYREAIFAAIGDIDKEETATIVESISTSAIKSQLIAAIDEWGAIEGDESVRKKLFKINVAADPDPIKTKIRDESNWKNREVLFELAKAVDPKTTTPSILLLLADKLHALPEPKAKRMEQTKNEFILYSVATREAMLLLERALPWHQDDYWIHWRLADLSEYLALWEDQAAYLMAAAAIRPHDAKPLKELGWRKLKLNRFTSSEANYRRALDLEGPSAQNFSNIAKVLSTKAGKTGQYSEEAFTLFKKALELDPKSASINYAVGVNFGLAGRSKDCIPYYRKTIELDPGYDTARHNLAYALKEVGQPEEALEVMRPLMERKKPTFSMAYSTNGEILMALERYEEAKPFLVRVRDQYARRQVIPEAVKSLTKKIEGCENYPRIAKQFSDDPAKVSGADAIELIEFYDQEGLHRETVARLYQHLLENRIDEIEKDQLTTRRYNAACCGIKVEPSKENWREFAYKQLSILLDESKSTIESLPDNEGEREKAKAQLLGLLQHWNDDEDLVPIRDGLEKLPEAERDKWTKFWDRHATMLAKLKTDDSEE